VGQHDAGGSRAQRKYPTRFTSITLRQRAASNSTESPEIRIPAFDTNTFSPPRVAHASSIPARTSSAFVTSTRRPTTFRPVFAATAAAVS